MKVQMDGESVQKGLRVGSIYLKLEYILKGITLHSSKEVKAVNPK